MLFSMENIAEIGTFCNNNETGRKKEKRCVCLSFAAISHVFTVERDRPLPHKNTLNAKVKIKSHIFANKMQYVWSINYHLPNRMR